MVVLHKGPRLTAPLCGNFMGNHGLQGKVRAQKPMFYRLVAHTVCPRSSVVDMFFASVMLSCKTHDVEAVGHNEDGGTRHAPLFRP